MRSVLPYFRAIALSFFICSIPAYARFQSADSSRPNSVMLRDQYVSGIKMTYVQGFGCTPNADWQAHDLFTLVCNDDGYAQVSMLYKPNAHSDAIAKLAELGFRAVRITTKNIAIVSGAPDLYYLITPHGLVPPNAQAIPQDNSREGRVEFVYLLYGSARERGCQAEATGNDARTIYLSCPSTKPETRDRLFGASNVSFAQELSKRGFSLFIIGNDQIGYLPAKISTSGFAILTPIPSTGLFADYGISSAERQSKEDAASLRYHEMIEEDARRILDFAVLRKDKMRTESKSATNWHAVYVSSEEKRLSEDLSGMY